MMSTPLLLLLVVLLLLHYEYAIASSSSSSSTSLSSSSSSIECLSGWTNQPIVVPPEHINDDYCDCPHDGADEPNTSACSGSVNWAGITSSSSVDANTRAREIKTVFGCPKQPSIHLHASKLNDGVCDCCDGADEIIVASSSSSSSSQHSTPATTATTPPPVVYTVECPDVCHIALADERKARSKLVNDYDIGSKRRERSIADYRTWHESRLMELRHLVDVELATSNDEVERIAKSTKDASLAFADDRLRYVYRHVAHAMSILELFDATEPTSAATITTSTITTSSAATATKSMSIYDVATFIISLCGLSAELAPDAYDDGKCRPLEYASLDMGIVWDEEDTNTDDALSSSSVVLPIYKKVDITTMIMTEKKSDNDDDVVLLEYAERIVNYLHDKKTMTTNIDASSSSSSTSNSRKARRSEERHQKNKAKHDDDSSDDDDEYHDEEDVEDVEEGHDHSEEVEDDGEKNEDGEGGGKWKPSSRHDESMVKLLLDRVPLNRTLFQTKSHLILQYTLSGGETKSETDVNDDDGATDEELIDAAVDAAAVVVDDATDGDNDKSGDKVASGGDPMAITMVKSTISKYLSQITRGEMSMKSAARYVSSVIQQSGENANDELHILAMLTIYHSNLAWEDIAELVYSTSEVLQITKEKETATTMSSCSLSLSNDMMTCPPHTVQVGEKTYPPSSIVYAAQKRCEQRENITKEVDGSGVCTESDAGGGEESFKFPTTITDGYLNYHPPKSRGPEDVLISVFAALEALHEPPLNIVQLRQREEDLRSKQTSLSKRIADMQNDLGQNDIDRARKYGVNGELYTLRDTCHKLEYGQYEYEVCIFGRATQRDIGQSDGGTNLGSWKAAYIDEMGRRTLEWEGGTKCWNGPNRSAEVAVTCGADTKLLTADEPETCKYAFTMESPIGCDETFKANNSL